MTTDDGPELTPTADISPDTSRSLKDRFAAYGTVVFNTPKPAIIMIVGIIITGVIVGYFFTIHDGMGLIIVETGIVIFLANIFGKSSGNTQRSYYTNTALSILIMLIGLYYIVLHPL